MIRTQKYLIAMLSSLAALDLIAAVLASRVTGSAKPPVPAVAVMVIIGVLTLAAIYGLRRGGRWARPVIYVTRGLDVVSSLLGLGDRPSVALVAIGAVTLVLSVAVIVLLARTPASELAPEGQWN
jgi:flagellar biogenesis protein FliO